MPLRLMQDSDRLMTIMIIGGVVAADLLAFWLILAK
jgi:hypothetical protein